MDNVKLIYRYNCCSAYHYIKNAKERYRFMRFDSMIESMRDDIVKTTQELIKIKSVETSAQPGAPFGKEMRICLDKALDICKNMGFEVKNFDGYAGHAEYGEGNENVGILVHLDVVPEGSDWSVEPYGGEVRDGKLFGRGAIDDKGPAVAALYALKAVKDAGEKFNKKVRIIFGCDEESGRWECMKHYFKHETMPDCGFSPDADFPIINSEMGIIIFNLKKSFAKAEESCCGGLKVKYIKGGNRPNMVPDYCECLIEMKRDFTDRISKTIQYFNEKQNSKIEASFDGEKCLVKSFGISAHGSTPDKGINAIAQMIRFLCNLPLCVNEQTALINFIDENIGFETNGRSFGVDMSDDVSGSLVFNFGIFELDEEGVNIGVNIRYPVTKTRDEVYTRLRQKTEGTGLELVEGAEKEPLYVPADNFLVKKLQKVYEDVTGLKPSLISIGGGTYARAIKNAVAFGPLFPGRPELAHQKDECIDIDDLIQCAKIYAEAIYELVK
jgi:succinyl-diaminopimelate desuccinylase